MNDKDSKEEISATFQHYRGSDGTFKTQKWDEVTEFVRTYLADSFNAKHVAFLLGAGCSSHKEGDVELGIPTMASLAKEFTENQATELAPNFPSPEESKNLRENLGINLKSDEFSKNLERLMEVLHCMRFFLQTSSLPQLTSFLGDVESLISKIQKFVWGKCSTSKKDLKSDPVQTFYETFYRKIVLRDRSLPRPWVFTTNYDLYSEKAMDRLGLPYSNGFSGIVERRFNPSVFRYALAEQLDLSNRKWSAVDGFIYLCKLHGSISWTEDERGLFPIREELTLEAPERVMIYPTPAKQRASLGTPYAELFREFQNRIVREQSVLFVFGYGFGDQHVNNIIYQALTIPTFRIVIFADPESTGEIKKLAELKDPRVTIIGGDGPSAGTKAHYFSSIVEYFLPQRPSEKIDDAVRKILETMSGEFPSDENRDKK